MSDHQHNEEISHLKQVNSQLTDSLERCRDLVKDCRAKLAANSNEPIGFDNDDEEDEEGSDFG